MISEPLASAIAKALVAITEQKIKPRNPVSVMNSVHALDLMNECRRLFCHGDVASPAMLDELREQVQCHRRALRTIIGSESL